MEKRTLEVSLEIARKWFNLDKPLKELALQMYTKDELTKEPWMKIKTMEDVLKACNMDLDVFNYHYLYLCSLSPASACAFKVNLIRKALNRGYNLSLTKDRIWYPYIPFITKSSIFYKENLKTKEKYVIGEIKNSNTTYKVLGGGATQGGNAGMGYFSSDDGVGYASANFGYLGCASKEIAIHFGKYFWKEIYQMMYADMIPDIEYIDLVDRDFDL